MIKSSTFLTLTSTTDELQILDSHNSIRPSAGNILAQFKTSSSVYIPAM